MANSATTIAVQKTWQPQRKDFVGTGASVPSHPRLVTAQHWVFQTLVAKTN